MPVTFRKAVHADKKHPEHLFFSANITRRAFLCYPVYTSLNIKKGGVISMEQQKKHDIALMKYSAIAPVISGLPAQYKSFSEYFREVSERGILHSDGRGRHL